MQPLGGSELAFQCLLDNIGDDWQSHINLILSTCHHENIDPNKINVVWQQLSYDQDNVKLMNDPSFVDKIDYFVYVSHWNYEKFRNVYNIPEHKSIVIKNATNSFINNQKDRTKKLKLIYTSTPWRGLHVLLDAFSLLNRDDVELDIFSSSIIYGTGFNSTYGDQYKPLYNRAREMKNVNYMGYSSNAGVRRAVENAHIFTYPCTFEETSCMSAIEAASAGCAMVTTNYGALYETCGDWSSYVPYQADHRKLAHVYADELNKCIENYWTDETQQKLIAQVYYYNKFYSWNVRKLEWRNFFDRISKEKT